MRELEQWLPNAIQAGTAVGQLWLGLTGRRQQQAADWGATLEELAGLDGPELRRIVEDNPAVAELVGLAWEEAARTAAEDKRHLLAQVAAAALRGDTAPEAIDALPLLLRTVIALDSPHIALLAVIAQSVDLTGRTNDADAQRIAISLLELEVPDPPVLLGPILAALERENLVRLIRDFADNPPPRWVSVTDYGKRFLDYFLVDAGSWPPER